MDCLDRFNRRMNYNGGSLRNENIKSSIELLKSTFYDDASYKPFVYFWELGDVGTENYKKKKNIPIRLYGGTFSNANGQTIKFQTPIECPVSVGDILYDAGNDSYSICTESFNIHDIHWQGKVTLCNWILRWQDTDGTILQYPCYTINATQYNSGEKSNKQFTIESSQHMIILPCDEKTVLLSSPQRFFLDKNTVDPMSFIVTQNDNTSYNYGEKGLVKLTVYAHPTNSDTDRIDLGICDYFEPESKTNTGNTITAVIECDDKVIKSGGNAKKYTAKFYDENKNMLSDITPIWNIICDFKNELEVSQSEDSIYIGIDNDYYVDEEFKLVLTNSQNDSTDSILIKIDSLL